MRSRTWSERTPNLVPFNRAKAPNQFEVHAYSHRDDGSPAPFCRPKNPFPQSRFTSDAVTCSYCLKKRDKIQR